jgi:hypothetical protein
MAKDSALQRQRSIAGSRTGAHFSVSGCIPGRPGCGRGRPMPGHVDVRSHDLSQCHCGRSTPTLHTYSKGPFGMAPGTAPGSVFQLQLPNEVLLARSCRKSCSHSAVLEGGARKCSSHRILARREWIWPWVPLPSSCSRMGTERWRVADLRAGAGEHGATARGGAGGRGVGAWSDGARRTGGLEPEQAARGAHRTGAADQSPMHTLVAPVDLGACLEHWPLAHPLLSSKRCRCLTPARRLLWGVVSAVP